jgi:hypothetical protein
LLQRHDCCLEATSCEHLASAPAGSCLRRFLATPLYEMMLLKGWKPESAASR